MEKQNSVFDFTETASVVNAIVQCWSLVHKIPQEMALQHHLDYFGWLFFLKCLEDRESRSLPVKRIALAPLASFNNTPYTWSVWIKNQVQTPQSITQFLKQELFPQLQACFGIDTNDFAIHPNFFSFRQLLEIIGNLDFGRTHQEDKIAYLYSKLFDMLTKQEKANRNQQIGVFSTPLPLVQFMAKLANPQVGQVVYDPACGTGNLLIAASQQMESSLPTTSIFMGGEIHSFILQLCRMNLILHNLDASYIDDQDVLQQLSFFEDEPIQQLSLFEQSVFNPFPSLNNDIPGKLFHRPDKKTLIILSHPPFHKLHSQSAPDSVKQKKQVTEFIDRSFLRYCMYRLVQPGDACVIVVSQNLLLNESKKDVELRKELITNFNLQAVIQLPVKMFAPFTQYPTYLLYFKKEKPSDNVFYSWIVSSEQYTKGNYQFSSVNFDQLISIWKGWIKTPTKPINDIPQTMMIQIKEHKVLCKPDFQYKLAIDPSPLAEPVMDIQARLDQLQCHCAELMKSIQHLRILISSKEDIYDANQ